MATVLDVMATSVYMVLAVIFAYLAVRFYLARRTSKDTAMTALFVLMLAILLDTAYWGVSTFYRFFEKGSYAYELLLGIRVDALLWLFPKLCVLLSGVYVIYTMIRIRAE